jgi:hypothetical protein
MQSIHHVPTPPSHHALIGALNIISESTFARLRYHAIALRFRELDFPLGPVVLSPERLTYPDVVPENRPLNDEA